jgi:uncharacterized protein YyaL (SSP411 family)
MGRLLEKAVAEASKLPEAEQEVVGAWLLAAFYSANDSDERTSRDEKILTDWNGLMIAALARGAAVLDARERIHAAI